jgi:hypothetical protein
MEDSLTRWAQAERATYETARLLEDARKLGYHAATIERQLRREPVASDTARRLAVELERLLLLCRSEETLYRAAHLEAGKLDV